jgi:hypothetical protein
VSYAGFGGVGQIGLYDPVTGVWRNTNMGNGDSVSCQLDISGTCVFQYTPVWSGTPLSRNPYTLSTHSITAAYSQSGYVASQATSAPMSIRRRTNVAYSTDPSCTSPVHVGQSTVCTASVDDIDTLTVRWPQGELSWALSTDSGQTFSPIATCPLNATASCSITFTPTVRGDNVFELTYTPTGDNFHNESGLSKGPWHLQVN